MVRRGRAASAAVAVVATALFVLSTACGGDGNGANPTDQPPAGTDTATPVATALEDVDLANAPNAIQLRGVDAEDLLTGTTSLSSGDFNDDGEPDYLIGAPQGDGPNDDRPDAGEAYIILGPVARSLDLGVTTPDVVIYGGAAGDGLGYSVLAADVNDDGRDDVLVGAPGVTAGFDPRTDQGRVYGFFGGSDLGEERQLDLVEDVYDVTITGAEGFSRLGHAMAGGDVDGDGASDLVVGAPFAGRLEGSAPGGERTALGEAYIILGHEDLSGERNIARDEYDSLISGSHALGEFGSTIAVADIDDDGTDDIMIGAHRASAGDPERGSSGEAFVFYGRDDFAQRISTQDGDEDALVVGEAGTTLGYPLATGDFNGDEVADVAIGAQLEANGDVQGSGAIHVLFGGDRLDQSIDLAATDADVRVVGQETSEFLPSALTSVDINGDGNDELIAGSMLVASGDDRFGGGLVYALSLHDATDSINVGTDSAATLLGSAAGDRLGNALAAGQSPEGVPLIVALAPLADAANQPDTGVVYLLGFQ